MASDSYHEALDLISEETKNLHRGIVSLMEELEAIDWYQQRADAASDDELRSVLLHNRNEEIEHAMMVLEWIRRHSPKFDQEMRTYLFREGPITAAEEQATGASGSESEGSSAAPAGPLGIGSLKGKE